MAARAGAGRDPRRESAQQPAVALSRDPGAHRRLRRPVAQSGGDRSGPAGDVHRRGPPLPRRQNDRFWLAATRAQVVSAPEIGALVVADPHDPSDRLRAGRAWQRLHLWAAAHGLAAPPHNQPAERADRERTLGRAPAFARALDDLVGDARGGALMTFRLGYALERTSASPRRPISAVLLSRAVRRILVL